MSRTRKIGGTGPVIEAGGDGDVVMTAGPVDSYVEVAPKAGAVPVGAVQNPENSGILTIRDPHRILAGHAKKFREVAEYLPEIWSYLMKKLDDHYGLERLRLEGVRRFVFNFELNDLHDISIRDLQVSIDRKTASMTIAVNKAQRELIFERLHPGALAYLIVLAAKNGTSKLALDMASPDWVSGENYGLYRKMTNEVLSFHTDISPILFEVKAALRRREIPKGFSDTLRGMGWTEADIAVIENAVTTGSVSFDIKRGERDDRDKIRLIDVERARLKDVNRTTLLNFRANPGTVESLSRAELYGLLARGLALSEIYDPVFLQYELVTRKELLRPVVIHMQGYRARAATSGGGIESMSMSFGRFAEEWIKGVTALFEFLYGIGAALKEKDLIGMVERGDSPSSATALKDFRGNRDVLAFVEIILRTGTWRSFSLFSGVSQFFVRRDIRLKKGEVQVKIRNSDKPMLYGRIAEIGVPMEGYEGLTIMDLIRALGTMNLVNIKMEKAGVSDLSDDAVALLSLWSGYKERAHLPEVAGISIDGGAGRGICGDVGEAVGELFASSKRDGLSFEGAAFRAWLKEQNIVQVEHLLQNDQNRGEVLIIPVQRGLMILLKGEAPVPAQWEAIVAAAYLHQDGPFVAYLDHKGLIPDFSVSGPFRNYVGDFLDALHGRKRSETLGAEQNPIWVTSKDLELKGRYLRALAWMGSNRMRFDSSMWPKPTDELEILKGKYRTFVKLYHSDMRPADADKDLFKEAVKHWHVLLGLAPVAEAPAVVMEAGGSEDGRVVMSASGERNRRLDIKNIGRIVEAMKEEGILPSVFKERMIDLARELGCDAERLASEMREGKGEFFGEISYLWGQGDLDNARRMMEDVRPKGGRPMK